MVSFWDDIDLLYSVCDEYDIQCYIYIDGFNEVGFFEYIVKIFNGCIFYVYYVEGVGGGYVFDVIQFVQYLNVLLSSIILIMLYMINIIDEYIDMVVNCYCLFKDNLDDLLFFKNCIRDEIIVVEDVLYDIGVISIMFLDL